MILSNGKLACNHCNTTEGVIERINYESDCDGYEMFIKVEYSTMSDNTHLCRKCTVRNLEFLIDSIEMGLCVDVSVSRN